MKKYDDCIIETKDNISTIKFNKDNLEALGDIVYLEFSVKEGDKVKKGDRLLVLESMKGTSELKSKIDGEIKEINTSLHDDPEEINKNPDVWLLKIKS